MKIKQKRFKTLPKTFGDLTIADRFKFASGNKKYVICRITEISTYYSDGSDVFKLSYQTYKDKPIIFFSR